MIPTTLSEHTLVPLIPFRKKSGLDDLRVLLFFSMGDRRKNLHRTVMGTFLRELEGVPAPATPYSRGVEQMRFHRAPLGSCASRGRAAKAYAAL